VNAKKDDSPVLEEEMSGQAMATAMSDAKALEPHLYKEAKRRPEWLRWKEAMDEELLALETYGTWKLEDLPQGANAVGCHWVYMLKRDAAGNVIRYKARLVAQGFSQVPGVDFFDTYSPVVKLASIRTSLAFGTRLDCEIHQVDIKNTYLNREFEDNEVIYMKQPPGVKLTSNPYAVLRLLRPLYGLQQSARHWY
jgi:hypothetical protein